MLLSHAYRFIFIKTTKTAGTSLEVDLSKILGKADIVTPIIPPVDGHRPRNHAQKRALGLGRIASALRLAGPARFYNHMSATSIRHEVGAETFESYFKFCVEREPVSKCISHYSMLKNSPHHCQQHKNLTWDAYVERGAFPVDADKYVGSDGALLVDQILRYEDLDAEMTALARRLGFPFTGVRAQAKTGFRERIIPTLEQKRRIYDAFAPSLEHCPYDMLDPRRGAAIADHDRIAGANTRKTARSETVAEPDAARDAQMPERRHNAAIV